ncbi:hypothetical protein LTR56_015278 [Elasticomyces elasticus]|nr:hypothetical protein LTR56_015278 [Elasticomyces elasticus]KAK3640376.1 hypothetical protein LTR22_017033 [Elasticomyces elasticus]KAK4913626.1 hypothetical protein LTR49_018040 [Elasticomyces elasticus]KAK5753053.1 hypothetical protein LTS12_016833 [Elasticomyces elasticus]
MAADRINTFLEAVADEDQTIMPELEVITTRTGHQAIYVGRCKNKHDEIVDAYVCPVGKTNIRAFETRRQKGKVLQEALAGYHIRIVEWQDESLDYHKYFATHQAASKFGNGYEAHKKWMLAIWRKNVEDEYPGVHRATSYGGDDDDGHLEFQGKDNGKGKTTTSDERGDMSPAEKMRVRTSRALPPLPEKLKPIEDHYCRTKTAREADADVKVQMAKEKRIKHEPQPSEDFDDENDLLQLMRNAGDKSPDKQFAESTPEPPVPGAPRLGTRTPSGTAKRRSDREQWDFLKRLKTIRNPTFRGIVNESLKSPALSFAEEIVIMSEKKAKEARTKAAKPTAPTTMTDSPSKKRNSSTLQQAHAKEQISDADVDKKEVRHWKIDSKYANIPGLMEYLNR